MFTVPRSPRANDTQEFFFQYVLSTIFFFFFFYLLRLCLLPVSQGFVYHADAGGSGHDRATASFLASVAVTGAEVRRISIGFEPEIGGRPKTP